MSKLFDHALAQVPDDVKRFIDNSMEIANEIHAILEKQGKTQKDLALLLGKNESEVSKWLTGRHNFTLKSLSKIEAVLNEKIVTTPLQSQMNFLKMAQRAIDFHNVKAQASLVLEKSNIQPVFVEISKFKFEQTRNGNVVAEIEESYSLVA